ncbi:MAG TPA: type II toxin-antitoxin system VapC family toxin [Candidatus Desulfaltia sp.]|nr:type II toxin-antitoxin system VapC family toxin [Candidatus Desulfaltia sp.]
MIVVDTNLLVYFYLRSEHSERAEKVYLKDPNWVAPLLWRSEFLNVLTACFRKGLVDFETAVEIIGEAELLMEGGEYSVGSLDILKLATGSRCSAYDCEFVALANELNIPLMTTDKQILADFPETAVHLDEYAGTA